MCTKLQTLALQDVTSLVHKYGNDYLKWSRPMIRKLRWEKNNEKITFHFYRAGLSRNIYLITFSPTIIFYFKNLSTLFSFTKTFSVYYNLNLCCRADMQLVCVVSLKALQNQQQVIILSWTFLCNMTKVHCIKRWIFCLTFLSGPQGVGDTITVCNPVVWSFVLDFFSFKLFWDISLIFLSFVFHLCLIGTFCLQCIKRSWRKTSQETPQETLPNSCLLWSRYLQNQHRAEIVASVWVFFYFSAWRNWRRLTLWPLFSPADKKGRTVQRCGLWEDRRRCQSESEQIYSSLASWTLEYRLNYLHF